MLVLGGALFPGPALAQARDSALWPGLLLGALLSVAAMLGLIASRRLAAALPRWFTAGFPACLALAAVATFVNALGGSGGTGPWTGMALGAGSLALVLAWRALPARTAQRPRPEKPAPDRQEAEAPWFLLTTTSDLRSTLPEADTEGVSQSYRAIHDAAAEAIITTDAAGTILSANPATEALFGYRIAEICGRALTQLVIDLDRLVQGELGGHPPTLHGRPCEATARRRDGREFPVELVTSRISREHHTAFITLLRDISERRQAERALRESNALFRAILEGTRESLFLMDREGQLLAINQTAARRLGREPQELVGALVFDLFPPEVRETRRRIFFEVIASGQPAQLEDQRAGREFAIHFYPILEASGEVSAVSVFAQDITERKHAEAQLREAHKQLSDMSNELPCVVFQYRSDREARGRFSFVGGRIRDLDQVSPEAVLADPAVLLRNILPDDRPVHIASLKRAAKRLQSWQSDFRVQSTGGNLRWLHAAAVLRLDATGEVVWNGYWLDITDRKLAEVALADSRNLLQGILDGTGEALVLLDPAANILAANATAARRVQSTPAALQGKNFFSLFPSETSAQRRVTFERCLATGVPQTMEDNRSGRYSAINFYPVADSTGHTQSVVLFARDITVAKLAEAGLRESEQRYREVFEKLQVGYFRTSIEGRIESVNPRAAQLLGYDSAAELCTREAADIYFDLVDREALKRQLARDGKVANYAMSLRRKDGTPLYILANAEFLRDAQGQPSHIETSVQDVSALRELEDRLRESEARFRQHLFGLPIEICICDARGVVEYGNQQYLATIGYTKTDAPSLAEWWAIAVPDPAYRAAISLRWREATLAVADTEAASAMPQARLRGKDGITRVFDIVSRRLGERYLVVFSNVTVREEAAQALHEAKEAAENAALARAQFLATMSHEIRTPLNGIIGMTELAIATATDQEQRRYLQIARGSADSLLGLLNTVLDFSKIEAGSLHAEYVAFDPRESIDEVIALLRPLAEKKGLVLHARLDPRLPKHIVSDPLRLRQILTNLLANAIKFTEKGEIELALDLEETHDTNLGLHFRIQDTGIGIAEDRLQSIFASFVQADGSITRRYGGTGLGLAICAGLAEILGGAVWAESILGVGSTFHCTLRAGLPLNSEAV